MDESSSIYNLILECLYDIFWIAFSEINKLRIAILLETAAEIAQKINERIEKNVTTVKTWLLSAELRGCVTVKVSLL